jgi:hypothetical protein
MQTCCFSDGARLTMLDKTDVRTVRCPKCNGPMKLVEDAPRFAIFLLPCHSYRCDPCRIALSYPGEDDGDAAVE